jgi:hypothetical protein
VARWRNRDEGFPGPLAEFHEEDWPQVPGECLHHYACHGEGYGRPCVPRDGEFCGQLCYELLADRPELLARAKSGDAYERYHRARLAWLGKDHPGWFDEFLNGSGRRHEIRHGRPR